MSKKILGLDSEIDYSEMDEKTKELLKKSIERDDEFERDLEELERFRKEELELGKMSKEWEAFKPIFKEAVDIIIEKIKGAFEKKL